MRRTTRILFSVAVSLLLTGHGGGAGNVYMKKDTALEAAFPDAARVERKTLYFGEDDIERLEQRARQKVDSALYTVYIGYDAQGDALGYAFIDTREVRTKPATYMVVLDPGGEVRETRILAWMEPPEYEPNSRWLAQFTGQTAGARLKPGDDVDGISGATLSTRMLSAGVRLVLAVHALHLVENR